LLVDDPKAEVLFANGSFSGSFAGYSKPLKISFTHASVFYPSAIPERPSPILFF